MSSSPPSERAARRRRGPAGWTLRTRLLVAVVALVAAVCAIIGVATTLAMYQLQVGQLDARVDAAADRARHLGDQRGPGGDDHDPLPPLAESPDAIATHPEDGGAEKVWKAAARAWQPLSAAQVAAAHGSTGLLRRCQRDLERRGVRRPAPGVLEAIRDADRILICPSNPLISIGPILAVAQIRDQLRAHNEKVFAVCPIVGGKSLKGPSDKMLAQLGHNPTTLGVAKLYSDFTGTFVIDPADKSQVPAVAALGMKAVILPTVMKTLAQKRNLARALLSLSL